MNARLKNLVSLFPQNNIDALLVTQDANITYLTDFPASESWLLVCPKKVFYITDFRYILEAQKGLKGITVKRYTKSVFETIADLLDTMKVRRLGFDDRHLSLAMFKRLKAGLSKEKSLITKNHLVEQLREIKDKKEITQIKKALQLNLKAFQYLKGVIKPGITERKVLTKLEDYVKSRGAGFSFDPIVASGPNSCFPHAQVTDRKIRNNEPVLVDMGIDIGGYKSDLTRMFFLGKIPQLVRDVNAIVKEAQGKAIAKIKADIEASKIDQAARNYLAKNRLAKFFGHSLGHGVGLEIHETPRISQNNSSILKENMIFTVEPAVYIPNKFGIRIEDMVLVTKEGCKVLSGNNN